MWTIICVETLHLFFLSTYAVYSCLQFAFQLVTYVRVSLISGLRSSCLHASSFFENCPHSSLVHPLDSQADSLEMPNSFFLKKDSSRSDRELDSSHCTRERKAAQHAGGEDGIPSFLPCFHASIHSFIHALWQPVRIRKCSYTEFPDVHAHVIIRAVSCFEKRNHY